MSGRDLLYKPQVPIPLNEEGTDGKPNKLGVKSPSGRDLGGVGDVVKARNEPKPAPSEGDKSSAPAYKAEYFNRDISGVRQVNLRTRGAQALRGGEGASDLRKIVLPPAHGIDNPDPATIRSAADLMGLEANFVHDLPGLLTRQGAIARSPGVTKEMLEARLAMLSAMVEARKAALKRMLHGRAKKPALSMTLSLARDANGQALEGTKDLAAEGTQLVQGTRAQADGLHRRLAKMLGIKL